MFLHIEDPSGKSGIEKTERHNEYVLAASVAEESAALERSCANHVCRGCECCGRKTEVSTAEATSRNIDGMDNYGFCSKGCLDTYNGALYKTFGKQAQFPQDGPAYPVRMAQEEYRQKTQRIADRFGLSREVVESEQTKRNVSLFVLEQQLEKEAEDMHKKQAA